MYLFGIDIGGTTVKIGFINTKGDILDKWEIKTDVSNKGANILQDIANSVKKYLKEKSIARDDVKGYGFGVPGPTKNSFVTFCPNLGWENVDVKKAFCECLGYDANVKASNDANVAAAGEFWKGDTTYHNVVFMTLGTGVGGGIIINDQVIDGADGAGGEIGHIFVDKIHNFECNCGLSGCLETVASATGIVRLAKAYINDFESELAKMQDFSAKDVIDKAKEGDLLGLKVLDEVTYYIAYAMSTIAATINPQAFLVGGGVSKAGDILIRGIMKHYEEIAFCSVKNTDIKLAKLKNDAGMIGAAYLVK